ncbi:MAG: hypothetical protein WAO76_06995 [Georgfuchsia sp.]
MITSRNVFLTLSIGLIGGGAIYPALPVNARVSKSNLISIPLVATKYNAGKVGKATLVPQGDKTEVVLTLSGVPNYTTRPIHFYTYVYDGTCSNRSAKPRYVLNDRVLADSLNPESGFGRGPIGAFIGPVQLSHIISVDFQTFRSTRYALSVRSSPADGNAEIFCGDNSH